MALITLADILVLNDKNAEHNGASDILTVPALLADMPAVPSSNGTKHSWVKTTAAPVVGFRSINTGRVMSATGRSIVTADLNLLDGSFQFDKLGAGALAGGQDELMALEGQSSLQACLYAFQKQLIRGTVGGDAAGFLGFEDAIDEVTTDVPFQDAGGSGSDELTSVWFLRLDNSGVKAVARPQIDMGPRVESFVTTAPGQGYYAVGKSVGAWVGVQIGDKWSLGRLANIGTDTGHTLTDKLIGNLYSKFPPEKRPTHIVMNARSIEQLRASKVPVNGIGTQAPYPTTILNMKIIVSTNVSNQEAQIV